MYNAGILTTGTELVKGEVLNTNSKDIANILEEHYITTHFHMTCGDSLEKLKRSLEFLSKNGCDLLIINGGLGPTNDDLTREAVAEFTGLPLMSHENAFKKLKAFYALKNLDLTEMQIRQAFMPEGAERLDNPNGTADGWILKGRHFDILALPGPPHECLPLIKNYLDTTQIKHTSDIHKHFFRVLHVSEGFLSETLQAKLAENEKYLRYRAHYPYIDIKFQCDDKALAQKIEEQISQALAPYYYWRDEITAIDRLKLLLAEQAQPFNIIDDASKGYFTSKLLNPSLLPLQQDIPAFEIACHGMEEYWLQKECEFYTITTTLRSMKKNKAFTYQDKIKSYTRKPLTVAKEIIAYHTLNKFKYLTEV